MPNATFDTTPLSFEADDRSSDEPPTLSFDPGSQATPEVVEADVLETVITVSHGIVSQTDTEDAVAPSVSKTHLVSDPSEWGWREVRDYVVEAIERRIGAFPRSPIKEKAIFESFCNRWGDKAGPIAQLAVEVHECWWRNSPLSVTRFCKGSDPYFAEPLAAKL